MVDFILYRKIFPEVHKWLDATYSETEKGVSPYRHWITRHNIESLKAQFGDQTREFRVGCMHVLCDWLWHLDRWELPLDESEVIEKLKENYMY